MTIGWWILIAALIIAFIFILVTSKRKKWYRVYMANNDMFEAYRTPYSWWWQDKPGRMGFFEKNGKMIWVSTHFMIKLLEIENPK